MLADRQHFFRCWSQNTDTFVFFSEQLLSFFLTVVNVACWLLECLLLLQDDNEDADDDYYLLGVWTFSMSIIYKMILAALQLLLLQSEPSLRSTLNHAPACTCRVWHSSWNSQQQQQKTVKYLKKMIIFCFHRVWPEETKFWRKKCWIFLQQQSCRSAASRAIENESSIDVQNYSYAANICRSVCVSVHLASSLTELLSSAVVYVTDDWCWSKMHITLSLNISLVYLYRWSFVRPSAVRLPV